MGESLRLERGLAPEAAGLQAALAGGSLAAALSHEPTRELRLRDELLALLEGARAPTRSRAWRPPKRWSRPRTRRRLLTTLRSLLRDLAALRAGATPEGLLNPDRAERLAALAAGPLGERATSLGGRPATPARRCGASRASC